MKSMQCVPKDNLLNSCIFKQRIKCAFSFELNIFVIVYLTANTQETGYLVLLLLLFADNEGKKQKQKWRLQYAQNILPSGDIELVIRETLFYLYVIWQNW